MLETAIAGLLMGTLGSFHCVGMCGPLALALPLNDNSLFSKFTGTLLYNGGRVFTYSLLGLVAGLLGKSFSMFGLQQLLSISLGVFMLILIIITKLFPSLLKGNKPGIHFFEKVRRIISQFFFKKNQSSLFAIGILNGLLPCGLVYLAIAAATAAGSVNNSVIFMAAFGTGTLPVMWSIAFWGNLVGNGIRQKIRSAYPYLVMLMACLLIIRGMGLGIPYLSPVIDQKTIHCAAKP